MAQVNEEEIREILNGESESDISHSETDLISECSSETESEQETISVEASSVDRLFIAKNNMEWSATPLPQSIRTVAENIITTQAGPTRFAVSRCDDMLSAFLLFFPPPIERIVIENTNKHGRIKFGAKWTDIDEDALRAYIAVLILAGVYRYVHSCFTYFCNISNLSMTAEKMRMSTVYLMKNLVALFSDRLCLKIHFI